MEDLSKKYNDKTLRLIIKTLLEKFDEEGVDYEDDFDEYICDYIDDTLKYVGINSVEWEDYSFYIQLLKINPNYETESINVPNLHKYIVDTDVRVYESAEETWRREVYSYFNSKDMITQQVENHPDHAYWEGEMIHREVYDSSSEDERIINIQKAEYRNKN